MWGSPPGEELRAEGQQSLGWQGTTAMGLCTLKNLWAWWPEATACQEVKAEIVQTRTTG